jgi:hypothetical protein
MNRKFGNKIRKLREVKKLLSRQLATMRDMKTAQFSNTLSGESYAQKNVDKIRKNPTGLFQMKYLYND